MGELAELFPKMINQLQKYDLILLSRYVDGGSDERIFIRVFAVNSLTSLQINTKQQN